MTKKTNKELRKFGLTIGTVLLILGGLLWWKGKDSSVYFLSIGGLFVLTGLIVPPILTPVEYLWMKFARGLGFVMNYVILTIAFYLVFTPVGLMMRLMGKDSLKLKFDKQAKSYWIKTEADGPNSRPEKPY